MKVKKLKDINIAYEVSKLTNRYSYYTYEVTFWIKEKYGTIGRSIGYIGLQKTRYKIGGIPIYETHSYLQENYHGKGIGTFMYSIAIEEAMKLGLRIGSSKRYSKFARRFWQSKSIRKLFKIRRENGFKNKRKPRYIVTGKA
jgi:GNAT superfamily N-acetyltransferase